MNAREIRLTADASLRLQPTKSHTHSGPTLQGYAAVFHSLSQDLGGFRERILPGAFSDTLKRHDVLGLYAHDNAAILGRAKNGSLVLSEDTHGLRFELHLPKTQLGADVAELVKRADISQCSFGFSVPKGGDDWSREHGVSIRTLKNVRLFEVSLVAEPAYTATVVSLRLAVDAVLAAALADRRRRLAELSA